MARPAVFLDRDGTLNLQVVKDGKPYPPPSLADFALFDDAFPSCARLYSAGFVLVVATNQPDVGRGTQSQEVVESMHAQLLRWIPSLSAIEVCYDPGRGQYSRRRKPQPGMLEDAAARHDLDLAASWMVGDRWGDIAAGHAAGCKTIFIDRGYLEPASKTPPHHTVSSLAQAAEIILTNRNHTTHSHDIA